MAAKLHPAEAYIQKIVSGEIPACYQVRSAYQRHVNDLAQCKEKGWVFNPNYAQMVINLFANLKHYKGEYAGKPLILEPWQQAIMWVVYGWRLKHANGPRRFTHVYLEIPKKNGKTTMLGGIGTLHFAFDGESGAEVYTAATKRDQAKLCFNDIKAFIENNPSLKKEFGIHTNTIFWEKTNSKIVPLSKESNTADGFNPSCAIVDELHRHSDSSMVNLLSNSMGTRLQPIIWEITTAGSNKQSVCYKHRQYTEAVNTNKFEDDRWFGLVYTLDENDDWRDPASWIKANPNLGTGKSYQYLADLVNKAVNDSSNENDVKRYHFNIWVGAEEKWISEEKWNQGNKEISEEDLQSVEVEVYGGLDLASTRDFNALTLTFINSFEGWMHQKYYFWCPKDRIDDRVEKQNMDFHQWVRKGYLREIPGNVADANILADDIRAICLKYNVKSLAYDKYLALHGTIQTLAEAGIEVVEQRQDIMSMSYPTKELEKLIISNKLSHEDNPVMSWMMGNVLIVKDANENMKIHKGKSIEKVDGPVSAVMSLAEYLDENYNSTDNPYNTRGLFD